MPASAESADARPRELDALDLKRLRSFSVARDYPADAAIFEEGDAGGEMFVIADGEVEITKKTESGKSLTLARLKAGDFFGEMAFVDQSPRSASAVASSPLNVHVLPAGSLERIFEYNVATALYFTGVLCKIMTRRLDATLRRIVSA
jgi:CRP-like cAMP-binding protein